MMTGCPSSEQLQRFLADLVAGPEAKAVEAHIETCAGCQQALDQLTRGPEVSVGRGSSPRSQSAGGFLRRLEQRPPAGPPPHSPTPPPPPETSKPDVEPTVLYREGDVPEGRIQVALAPGLSGGSLVEIAVLLRKRLRILTLIALGSWLIFYVLRFFRLTMVAETVWKTMVPGGVFLVLLTALTVIIWRPRLYSLRQLRQFEAVFFGLAVVFFAREDYSRLFLPPESWFPLYAARGPVELAILVGQVSITWLAMIVGYGTFIPNTGRRCAVVAGLMAMTPMTVAAVGGFTSPDTPPRLVVIFLVGMFIWMAVAVVMAIYGSHKISVLRQEALEARKLGQYRLKEQLGVGGMGEVYLAEHRFLKRPCAIKLIRPERAGDPRNLARFEREVQATVAISHPNIVEVFDYGHTEGGTFYYVMEYLPGLNLEELTRRHAPLPLGRIINLLRQACAALHEAHAAGLIHRDIKPSNMLVCQRGGRHDVVKLLDFGLVQTHGLHQDGHQLTQEGVIAGTPAYMSPEQGAGKGDLDARSDLYSLGAVAYFLLTGRPPFVRDSAVQTLAAHLGETVVPPGCLRRHIPADVQAVVLRCLEKSPAHRFRGADELAQALGRCGCAGEWTPEQAAAWWRDHAAGEQSTAGAGAGAPSLSAVRHPAKELRSS